MKKNIITAIVGVILLLSAGIANWDSLIFGGDPHVLGFALSLSACAYLIVIPFLYKASKKLTRATLCFSAVILVASVLGMLAANDVMSIDYLIVLFVIIVLPFSGLLLIHHNIVYIILIAISVFGAVMSVLNLKKLTQVEQNKE